MPSSRFYVNIGRPIRLAVLQDQAESASVPGVNATTLRPPRDSDPCVAPTFRTSRLRLRPLTYDDAAEIAALRRQTPRSLWWPSQSPQFHPGLWIYRAARQWAKRGFGPLAVAHRSSSRLLGICGLYFPGGISHVALDCTLAPPHCRQGYELEAAEPILHYASRSLSLRRLIGLAAPGQRAAMELFEACGMAYWKSVVYRHRAHLVYSVVRGKHARESGADVPEAAVKSTSTASKDSVLTTVGRLRASFGADLTARG